MIGRRVLILVPHPDDEIVGCGAAIARAARLPG
jgi:LmbE family N-acetylglucosaminyl deacetylase